MKAGTHCTVYTPTKFSQSESCSCRALSCQPEGTWREKHAEKFGKRQCGRRVMLLLLLSFLLLA